MEKKTFINPSASVMKLESSALICGSGSVTSGIKNGDSSGSAKPEATTQGGFTGIFTDSRNGGSGIRVDALDF